jgi:hypothetical protein
MRIGFVAGRLDRSGSKVFIAPGGAARDFPGPWRLAAVIRISESGALDADLPSITLRHGRRAERVQNRQRGAGLYGLPR